MDGRSAGSIKKPLSEKELPEILENDEEMDEFMMDLDNKQDTDIQSDDEEVSDEWIQHQLPRVEKGNCVVGNEIPQKDMDNNSDSEAENENIKSII